MIAEIVTPRTLIRPMREDDFPAILAWPPYPWPYESFSMTLARGSAPDDRPWWQRIDAPDRRHFTVLSRESGKPIGVYAFCAVDWTAGVVGNMGIRFRPDCCGNGYGKETFLPLIDAFTRDGFRLIRLDVAASNERARRCYEKCGLRVTGEFWEPRPGAPIDPADPKWSFALPHLRREGNVWQERFYWMEIASPRLQLQLPPKGDV